MSYEQTRFTLMAFPQKVDADGLLSLNIVFIPRNISPLNEVSTNYAPGNKAKAFADVKPEFEIRVVNNPNEFPGKLPLEERSVAPNGALLYGSNLKKIYKTLKDAKDENGKPKYFDIDESRGADVNPNSKHTAPKAEQNRDLAIRKYLPFSYRKAFNFTAPRLKNAVTDDSYQCAMREQTTPKPMVQDDKVSWGKVYAHLMRQPFMAKQAGLIYETSIKLEPGDFENGGWIYVDIKKDTTYYKEQVASMPDAQGPFIKRYAARIPMLKENEARNLFSAILFPVMKAGQSPTGVYDELYIEASRFNEGFAGIVHANQPVSGNLLQEEQDGFHPQKEAGIRLGWEDEQLLIWYLRQLSVEENSTDRLDAPMGVSGYKIDVKKSTDDANAWESLNLVQSNGDMLLETISLGSFQGEIPYQVYPVKLYDGSDDSTNYWLPMYFANWSNQSLALPDKVAARIYQSAKEKNTPVKVSETYSAQSINTQLAYGNEYHFRVRLADISGGGPAPSSPSPENASVSHIAKAKFKRYVAPHSVTIVNEDEIQSNTDDQTFAGSSLKLSRPLLGYPAVTFTGNKYSDPIGRLAQAAEDLIQLQIATKADTVSKGAKAFGIPDPDVHCIEIKVEVETLNMDNLASEDGREHYITLYTTNRFFPTFDENKADESIEVPITFKDVDVLNLNDPLNPYPEVADNACVTAAEGEVILPTARNLRITLRAVGEPKPSYWGIENLENTKLDSRFGKPTVITMREESKSETAIFTDTTNPQTLQAIYLQPDPLSVKLDPIAMRTLQGGRTGLPDIVQRLGQQLDVAVNGLTLTAENGERLQFWCSNQIRHSMAPDNSSITFANKNELQHQWLVCTTLYIDRDWTWDSLDASSFHIRRKRRLGNDITPLASKSYEFIGDLELRKVASFQAIQAGKDGKVHREYTRIILIDVIDDKPAAGKMPDTLEVQYAIEPKFRPGHNPINNGIFETEALGLPTTINPTQTPKLIAAGIALSPYNRNEKYSSTEARTRYLWLEFDEKPIDNRDSIFCRVLAYGPDQLISNNHPSMMGLPDEPPIPLDPEYIRVITPASAHDHNGLSAMQAMEKSIDTNRHFYLMPLPPGLHHESAELFGMFTYEFRYGHTDKLWSTAQGRFGRPLRVAGLQHPAPTLHCMVNRGEKQIIVNAPYALAVYQGKNVTSSPPNTSLWGLLYAQVKQADGLDYRNILLGEKELKPIPARTEKDMIQHLERDYKVSKKKGSVSLNAESMRMNAIQQIAIEKEQVKQGFIRWSNQEVAEMLNLYGLPADSSLSVLCVEVYRPITNAFEHIDNFNGNKKELIDKTAVTFNAAVAQEYKQSIVDVKKTPPRMPMDPLNSQLGMFRILRTSPLTEVPFVCCTD